VATYSETRKAELEKVFEGVENVREIVLPLIDDVVFLEERLKALRELPFIRVNPKNPAIQKPTPAAKQYKELLQQYNNCIKILATTVNRAEVEEDSPLRAFVKTLGVLANNE